jgi:leishmanolysin-like peptidase
MAVPFFFAGWAAGAVAQVAKPHIMLVVADDYGWHNVGWRNSEIVTPNIDALAAEGIVLDRHYTFKYCSPTRSSLLTGRLPLHVNQNNEANAVHSRSGADLRMTLLPEKLKSVGYATAMTGKWHLGARSLANLPINRGFDTHFGFLRGGEDHCAQTLSEGTKVVDLWNNHTPAHGRNGRAGQHPQDCDFETYSTALYAREAVRVIAAHDAAAAPLFLYLPFQGAAVPARSRVAAVQWRPSARSSRSHSISPFAPPVPPSRIRSRRTRNCALPFCPPVLAQSRTARTRSRNST